MLISGPIATNSYLVEDETSNEAVLIDAPHEVAAKVASALKGGARLAYLLNTHGHWDHVGDNAAVVSAFGAKLAIHSADAGMLEDGGAYGFDLPFKVPASTPSRMLAEGDNLEFGSCSLAVFHTPGHTAGSICFYDEKGGNLFSGDTLFDGSYGRTDLPNSSAKDMIESLARLSGLPPETKVFPGHGETTTIGEQTWLKRR